MKIEKESVVKIIDAIDEGLVYGGGVPVKGQMCVEEAICFGLGLEHSYKPICVAPELYNIGMEFNDLIWSTEQSRAKGMRRFAIAQLGTRDNFDSKIFINKVKTMLIQKIAPEALRLIDEPIFEICAWICEYEPEQKSVTQVLEILDLHETVEQETFESIVYLLRFIEEVTGDPELGNIPSDIVHPASLLRELKDESVFMEFAEGLVQILVEMETEGSKFLYLTE